MSDYKLVYSTDPRENQRCPRCRELQAACSCPKEEALPDKIVVRLRMENKGRGGKSVTVLDDLPAAKEFLIQLTKELKKQLGTGGTSFLNPKGRGTVEIQGDHREAIRAFLGKKGYQVKG